MKLRYLSLCSAVTMIAFCLVLMVLVGIEAMPYSYNSFNKTESCRLSHRLVSLARPNCDEVQVMIPFCHGVCFSLFRYDSTDAEPNICRACFAVESKEVEHEVILNCIKEDVPFQDRLKVFKIECGCKRISC